MLSDFPLWHRSRLPRVRVLEGPRANARAHLDDWIKAQAEEPAAPVGVREVGGNNRSPARTQAENGEGDPARGETIGERRTPMNILTQTALDIARGFVGIKEVGGNNRGPEVEAWLARVGLPPGNAWCMAFAWCCVDDAFRKMELPNPIRPCASVVRTWHALPDTCKLTEPAPGVWAFHHDSANPNFGHVEFIDDLDPLGKGTYTVGGNTNSEGSRTGGGVWRHTPAIRPLGYWNLGFADYSVIAAICLPEVAPDPDVTQ